MSTKSWGCQSTGRHPLSKSWGVTTPCLYSNSNTPTIAPVTYSALETVNASALYKLTVQLNLIDDEDELNFATKTTSSTPEPARPRPDQDGITQRRF